MQLPEEQHLPAVCSRDAEAASVNSPVALKAALGDLAYSGCSEHFWSGTNHDPPREATTSPSMKAAQRIEIDMRLLPDWSDGRRGLGDVERKGEWGGADRQAYSEIPRKPAFRVMACRLRLRHLM